MSEIIERCARVADEYLSATCSNAGGETAAMRLTAASIAEGIRSLADTSGWQPIETAPKDGERILAVRFDQVDGQQVVGAIVHWSRLEEKWFSLAVGAYLIPTHWMPLPTAPEVKP